MLSLAKKEYDTVRFAQNSFKVSVGVYVMLKSSIISCPRQMFGRVKVKPLIKHSKLVKSELRDFQKLF